MQRIAALLFAVLALSGCSSKEQFRKTFPVTGTLTIDGAPAEAGVLISLHPQFEETDQFPIHPKGETIAGGKFVMMTYKTDDGAPEGEYVATVEWPQRVGMSPHFSGDLFGGAFSKIDANKARPEFVVKVVKDSGAVMTLNLKLTPAQKSAFEAAKRRVEQKNNMFNKGE